jgi:hypothetical protein
MPHQLTDEQMAYFQSQDYKAKLADDLWNDPQLGKEAKALVKKKHPNISIPDYDIEANVERRISEYQKQQEEAKAKEKEEADKKYWDSQRSETQKKYSITEDGMKDLEKFMVERNIGDYEVAASYRISKEPKQNEASYDSNRWGFQKAAGVEEIAKDPEAWGQGQILKALYADQERTKNQKF